MARRRLAVLAMSREVVHEALSPDTGAAAVAERPSVADGTQQALAFDGFGASATVPPAEAPALVGELEGLAHDILVTPGAGGALLAAYAQQARLLALVHEAAKRAPDAPLPPSVRQAVARAARTSSETLLPFVDA